MKTKAPRKKLDQYGFGTGIQTQIFSAGANYLLDSAAQGLNTIFSNHLPTADGQMFNIPDGGQIMAMGGTVDDPKDSTKVVPPPTPLVVDDNVKTEWNKFQDYLKTNKLSGSTDLDIKDKNLGQTYLDSYKKLNPNSPLTYDYIKPIQQSLQDYRKQSWQRVQDGKAVSDAKTYDEYMSNISAVDGWLGSKTSNFRFPKTSFNGKDVGLAVPTMTAKDQFNNLTIPKMAMGGITGANAEVEGGEVAELPNGQTGQFQGPSHEEGGIPTNLPNGTKIYSDRLAVDGKTMQQRKQSRERRLSKLSKMLDTNPTDTINKNSVQRQKAFLDLEDQQDLMLQEAANRTYQAPQQSSQEPEAQPQFAMGTGGAGTGLTSYDDWMRMITPQSTGVVQDPTFHPKSNLPGYVAPANPTMVADSRPSTSDAMPYTTGDKMGFMGNLINGIAPLATTVANREGDTPNVNSFKDFGKNAIQANRQAISLLGGIKDKTLTDIQTQATGQRARNRNSAGSVSVNRALDLATTAQSDAAINGAYANYAQQLAGQYNEESKLDNQQDLYVEQGAQGADRANRADRDAYYTNLGQNLANIGSLTQKTGKEINEHQYSNDVLNLLPELSKYGLGYTYDETGKPVLSKLK